MIEGSLYYYKQPVVENPTKTVVSFFKDFDAALKAMQRDVESFFGDTDISVALDCLGLEYNRTGNSFAIASFEEFEWSVGEVA